MALGRVYMWDLSVAGEEGVREVINNFLAEFVLTMAPGGYRSCGELIEGALMRTDG